MTGGGVERLPLLVVGGYLGSGKTTLINRILTEGGHAGGRVAVVVNDFGDVTIDDALVASADEDTIALANGCICCSAVDGLGEALDRIRARAADLDSVIVEVSGVGDPRRVARWALTPGFAPAGVAVLADATSVEQRAADPYVGDTVLAQLAGADLVCITKVDLTDDEGASIARWLADRCDAAITRGVPSITDRIDGIGSAATVAPPHDAHVSVSRVGLGLTGRQAIDALVASRPPSVVRVKGILPADDAERAWEVHVVGDFVAVRGRELPRAGSGRLLAIARPGTDSAVLDTWLADNGF